MWLVRYSLTPDDRTSVSFDPVSICPPPAAGRPRAAEQLPAVGTRSAPSWSSAAGVCTLCAPRPVWAAAGRPCSDLTCTHAVDVPPPWLFSVAAAVLVVVVVVAVDVVVVAAAVVVVVAVAAAAAAAAADSTVVVVAEQSTSVDVFVLVEH